MAWIWKRRYGEERGGGEERRRCGKIRVRGGVVRRGREGVKEKGREGFEEKGREGMVRIWKRRYGEERGGGVGR